VKDFAFFMAIGVMLAFCVSLLFLPAAFALLPPTDESVSQATTQKRSPVLQALSYFVLHGRPAIYGVSLVLAAVAAWGMTKVRVDQRFIEYFEESTEVYQGLEFVDRVGGTMTLEVILRGDKKDYWLEEANYARIKAVHDYCEQLPQAGKVLSLLSIREHARRVLVEKKMGFMANMPMKQLVASASMLGMKKEDLDSVASLVATADFSTTRVYVRLRESADDLRRIELLDDLHDFLRNDEALAAEWEKPEDQQPLVTGMFVLFTNMLNTLVDSQVKSFTWVFAAVGLMLAFLFRNVGVGLLAMPPNLLPIATVLGTMGLAAITLDLMTIMIASISLGIAVDACIHYVVRFRHELRETGSYAASVPLAHQSIGKAILYTAVTVFAGFFVMVLSRFTPTRYFGLLTGVAMVASLLANLILLPALLVSFRVFRKEAGADAPAGEGAARD